MITVGIVAVILSATTMNLLSAKYKASLNSIKTQFIADLKQQQLKSMIGDTEGSGSPDKFGIHLDEHQYILFKGSPYTENPNNYTIALQEDLIFDPNGGSIIFEQGSGEIATESTISCIIIKNITNSEAKYISINSLGVVTKVDNIACL